MEKILASAFLKDSVVINTFNRAQYLRNAVVCRYTVYDKFGNARFLVTVPSAYV